MLEELESLKERKGQLEAEVQKYRDSDPELIEVLKKEIDLSKQSANRYLLMSQAYVKSTNSKSFKITYPYTLIQVDGKHLQPSLMDPKEVP